MENQWKTNGKPMENQWIQSMFHPHESHSKSHESHLWFCCSFFVGENLLMDLDLLGGVIKKTNLALTKKYE